MPDVQPGEIVLFQSQIKPKSGTKSPRGKVKYTTTSGIFPARKDVNRAKLKLALW